jgi:hypoxanthine phosphoribosyltransferase
MTHYTHNDTNPMSWNEFGVILSTLIEKIVLYQNNHSIKFDIIAPILRSGMIPATAIANKLKITRILPIQVKYIYNELSQKPDLKQVLSTPKLLQPISELPNILICESNTGSGRSAQKVIELIIKEYPNANLYYSTVAKVYGGHDKFDNIKEYFYGIQTNEFFKASNIEEKQLNLRPKITIFPWETTEYELLDINL